MPYNVRGGCEHDYDAIVQLIQALDPSCAAHRHVWQAAGQQSLSHPTPVRRFSAVDAATQQLVGSGAWRHERLDKFRLDVVVHPLWYGQGIGSQLLTHLLDGLRAVRAGTVHTRIPETATTALAFFQHRGFVETQRVCELRLDLRSFELARFLPLVEQIRARGVTIRTLYDEAQTDPHCWDHLQALQNAVLPDWPDFDPGPVELLEGDAFRRYLESFHVIPEGFFIAKDASGYIGYSGLGLRPGDGPGVVENTGTAIRREYRGQHLATVLKVHCLAYAQQYGYQIAATRSGNPIMVRVNENLGFQRLPGEVRLVRSLRDGAQQIEA